MIQQIVDLLLLFQLLLRFWKRLLPPSYLEKNDLLHPHQGACRYRRSTEDFLLVGCCYYC